MPKKVIMEDMKSKGVKITRIEKKKEELVFEKPQPLPLHEERIALEETEGVRSPHLKYQREEHSRISSSPHMKKRTGGVRKSYLLILLLVIILGGGYYLATVFEKASVVVVAKHQTFTLDHKVFQGSNLPNTSVHFEIMIVTTDDYKDINLSNPQTVSTKATGEVTLYNEFSTKPITISANTFVSDSSGKTYQTSKAVSIPGYKTALGKISAGSVSVGITAFLVGDQYNGAPADFTINAYKGTAKASKIYGKLKTELTGGAQGTVYALNPSEKGLVNATAESTFKSNLLKKVNAEVPPGYILYSDALQFSYKTDVEKLYNTSNARVKITGTIASIILNTKDLSATLVKTVLPGISARESAEVRLPDVSALKFSFATPGQQVTKDLKSLGFTLTGTLNAIWSPDVALLMQSLPGARKDSLTPIFKFDPGIVSASTSIFPPWQAYMPVEGSRINIEVK